MHPFIVYIVIIKKNILPKLYSHLWKKCSVSPFRTLETDITIYLNGERITGVWQLCKFTLQGIQQKSWIRQNRKSHPQCTCMQSDKTVRHNSIHIITIWLFLFRPSFSSSDINYLLCQYDLLSDRMYDMLTLNIFSIIKNDMLHNYFCNVNKAGIKLRFS